MYRNLATLKKFMQRKLHLNAECVFVGILKNGYFRTFAGILNVDRINVFSLNFFIRKEMH